MARGGDDEARVEPIILLPLVEHDLEAAEPKRDEQEADPVDLEAAPPLLGALSAQDLRLVDEESTSASESRPIGTLMKKIQCQEILSVIEPPIVGPSAGADDHGHAIEREGLRALRGRKGVGEHRLLARREAAAAEPLEHAGRDQRR